MSVLDEEARNPTSGMEKEEGGKPAVALTEKFLVPGTQDEENADSRGKREHFGQKNGFSEKAEEVEHLNRQRQVGIEIRGPGNDSALQ